MEFQNRNPLHPGRIRLTPVDGQNLIFDVTLLDGAGTPANPAGTPLNKQTLYN